MNVLLTGSTGMLGRAFLRIAEPNMSVKAMVRQSDQTADLDKSSPATGGREFVIAGLESETSLMEACRDVDAVVHSAALSSPWGRKSDFESINVQGTKNLLNAAEAQGVQQFVFVSSPSVYFDFKNGLQITEQQPLPQKFCNDYAQSKARAETVVSKSQMSVTILRPRGIFGPHDRAIVPRLLAAISNNRLVLPSARNPLVDLTYVDNVAMAIIKALRAGCPREIFNITNGRPEHLLSMLTMLLDQVAPGTKIKTLPYSVMSRVATAAECVCKLLPTQPEPRLTSYSAGLFHYDQTLCIANAVSKLNYRPAVSIEEGISRYAQWYRTHGS